MSVLILLLATTLSAGSEEFDRVAVEGAAKIALARIKGDILSAPMPGDPLREAMLADPAKFASVSDARRICREIYVAMLRTRFQTEGDRVRVRLGLAPVGAVLTADELAKAVTNGFEAAFARQRAAACADQAARIVAGTRPREEEFDAVADDAQLACRMTERIVRAQREPVFEENRAYISEHLVEPVVRAGRKERQRQRDYLMRVGSDACAPSRLAAELTRRLVANVADRHAHAVDPTRAWNVFPALTNADLTAVVERRLVNRLVRTIDDVELDVCASLLRTEMAKNPSAHVKAAASERHFTASYKGQLAVAACAKLSDESRPEERTEVAAYLKKRLTALSVTKATASRIRRDILPRWREARQQLAAREAERLWPTLKDGTWHPSPELADRVAARSDYAAAVRGWCRLEGLVGLVTAQDDKFVMEESSVWADAAVKVAFDRARDAISGQLAIVDRVQGDVLAEARRRKDSFWSRTPNLAAIRGLLIEATLSKWSEIRETTLWPDGKKPINADEVYVELFPSVRKKIDLLARVILEEMNVPEPPEEKSGLSITISRDNDRVSVRLEQDGRELESRTVPPRKDDFRKAMDAVTRKLSDDILHLPK